MSVQHSSLSPASIGSFRRGLVAGAVLVCAACSGTVPSEPTAELLALNAAYDRALVEADSVALDSLYHPDFTYLGPGGVVRSRASQIHALMSGHVDVIEGGSDIVTVRVYGSVAVMLGEFRGRARVGTDTFALHERYSTTWLRESGRWTLVLEHGSIMREPGTPGA